MGHLHRLFIEGLGIILCKLRCFHVEKPCLCKVQALLYRVLLSELAVMGPQKPIQACLEYLSIDKFKPSLLV